MAGLSQSPSLLISGSGSWPQLPTTHATGTQIVDAKMMSLDAIFCRGNKSSSLSFVRFCRRKHKKSTARASRLWAEQINYLPRQIIDLRDTHKSQFFTITELNTVNPLLSPPSLISPARLITLTSTLIILVIVSITKSLNLIGSDNVYL